jgi:hypothetical protein
VLGCGCENGRKGKTFGPVCALYIHARRLEKVTRAAAGAVAAVKLGAAERRLWILWPRKAAAAAIQMLAAQLGAYVRIGSPTSGSGAVFDFS